MGSKYVSNDIADSASSKCREDLSGCRIKFLCSYRGQILPRPSDGQLRYVGGETRLVTVDRSIIFQDFMKKLEDVFETMSVIIKYQLPTLDLDTLISVVYDEDLQNMMEEFDRFGIYKERSTHPRWRAFLFPQIPPLPSIENQLSPKQRYLDAVNGLTPNLVKQKIPSSALLNVPDYFSDPESSGATEIECQSPVSPLMDEPPLMSGPSSLYQQYMRKVPSEGAVMNSSSKMGINLHRVHSSPSLIRPCQTHILPVSICNIIPSRQVLMGNNRHGRSVTIHRAAGRTPTLDGSPQLAHHGATKVKSNIYASNRTGSPLKFMTNQMNSKKP